MSKAGQLKRIGAPIIYRDCVDGTYRYVEGEVQDFQSVAAAQREWGQKWSHHHGTVLAIKPAEIVDDPRVKFRHLSSCLTPEQFQAKQIVGVTA